MARLAVRTYGMKGLWQGASSETIGWKICGKVLNVRIYLIKVLWQGECCGDIWGEMSVARVDL